MGAHASLLVVGLFVACLALLALSAWAPASSSVTSAPAAIHVEYGR